MLEDPISINNNSGILSNIDPIIFPSEFNLYSVNGVNGFAINGFGSSDNSGSSVSGAGDFNNDGIDDIIIGTRQAGWSYIIFGSKDPFPIPLNLYSLNGANGFSMSGVNPAQNSGASVSGAGDINGDGIADVIIGAPPGTFSIGSGQSYIVFGSENAFSAQFYLGSLNGQNGFILNGCDIYSNCGFSVDGAGDVNGDGIADIIVGAPLTYQNAGKSYLVFGSKNAFPAQFSISSLNGQNGFTLNGIANDYSGASVSGAGDVNNDGIDDIIIGAPTMNGRTPGKSYVVFGSKNVFPLQFSLGSLNGQNGFTIKGINVNDQAGASVSGIGDFNGDGIGDMIIGAPYSGQVYIVFGSKAFPAQLNLTSLNGINGFTINNSFANSDSNTGGSVGGVGDINKDGIADIIIGANGQSYIVFGSNKGFNSTFDLSNLNGVNGFVVTGVSGGDTVSGAGDINGDNASDFIVGVSGALNGAGQSYVVFNASMVVSPTPSPTPSITATPSYTAYATPSPTHSSPSEDHELSMTAIIWITIGSIAGAAVLLFGSCVVCTIIDRLRHPERYARLPDPVIHRNPEPEPVYEIVTIIRRVIRRG